MIKAVIFDKDGVLAKAVGFNVEAGVMSFREIGIELDEEDRKNIIGRHPADYNKILAKKYKFNKNKVLERQELHYERLYQDVEMFEGAKELVSELKKKKLKLGLATSARKKEVELLFNRFGLSDYFDSIVTFEDCKERKPAPDIYLITAEKLGVSPGEGLVIEDSLVGIESAKRAGMRCVAVANTVSKDELRGADYIINNLKEFNFNWLN